MAYAKAVRRRAIWALAAVVVVFLVLSVPPYLTGDPSVSRVPATFAAHYPLLVAHIVFASAAMAAALWQIWPSLRRRHPALHRRVGRIYVFGAVLPAGVCALVIGAATPFGPLLAVSNVLAACLWMGCTAAGYRAARAGRVDAHRRWMTRSVVLTFSIISNRIWAPVLYIGLSPLRDSMFGGDEVLLMSVVAGLTGWLGWTVPLVVTEYLLRRQRRGRFQPRIDTAARYCPRDLVDRKVPTRTEFENGGPIQRQDRAGYS